MRKVEIITAEQAAQLVKDNDTITSIGFVSSAHPEALTKALEKRFLDTNTPQNLTYIYAGSQGKRARAALTQGTRCCCCGACALARFSWASCGAGNGAS